MPLSIASRGCQEGLVSEGGLLRRSFLIRPDFAYLTHFFWQENLKSFEGLGAALA